MILACGPLCQLTLRRWGVGGQKLSLKTSRLVKLHMPYGCAHRGRRCAREWELAKPITTTELARGLLGALRARRERYTERANVDNIYLPLWRGRLLYITSEKRNERSE